MALQEMLESPQWQTSTLPSLWRALEQDARQEFCAAAEGNFTAADRPWAIPACEKRAHLRMELGWNNDTSSQRKKWICKDDQTRSRKTQETRQRTSLCRPDHAAALEARRHCLEGPDFSAICSCHSSSGMDQGDQRSIWRREGHASQHQAHARKARPQQWPTLDGINQQNHQRPGEGARQPAEALRSKGQTSHTVDEPYEEPHGNIIQTGRSLRSPAEELRRQDQIQPTRYSGDETRVEKTHCASGSRSLHRDHRGRPRRGRADGHCHQADRCGRGCTSQPSPRTIGEMSESGRQIQSSGDRVRRGAHGYQHRKRKQKAQIGGTLWLIFSQVILGNDGVCLRKDHREPHPVLAKDADTSAEAYDYHGDSCAASWACSYKPWPTHPRTYNHDVCVQPFMALHDAYLLATQCGTWTTPTSENVEASPLISCFGILPTLTPYAKRLRDPRTVTFSTTVVVYMIDVDEIGPAFNSTMTPKMHRITDDHTRSAQERFRDEFQQQEAPIDLAHALAQQPAHIQGLAITLHQQGALDPYRQERYIKVLTWFIHGLESRECRMPRMVRLPEDFTRWNQLMCSAWFGLLHPHEALWFHIVDPEPPTAEWEEHDAQVILVQQPRHFERAVLYTSIYHAQAQVAIQRIARFSRSAIHLSDCIAEAEIPLQVQHRLIHGYYGWRTIHNPPLPAMNLADGAAVVVHVRPEPDSPSQHERYPFDFLWANDAYVPQHTRRPELRPRSRSPRRQVQHENDEASFMARQPRQIPRDEELFAESTESSASASTYDSDQPSSFFNIFQLQSPMYAARVRTDSWPLTYSQVRHVIGLNRHDIQYIHVASYRPADLYAAGTQVAIVQRAHDLQPGDHRRIVLIDVVFHEHHAEATMTHRYATLVRKDLTRRILLEELKLQEFCRQVRHQCIVQLNGRTIPLSSHTLYDVYHADYIRIDLPPHPKSSLPSRAVARCLRDGISFDIAQQQYDNGETDFEWETVQIERAEEPEDQDDTMLLQAQWNRRQTAEQVAHTQRPVTEAVILNLNELIPEPPQTCIDFAEVQWTAIELAHIPLDLLETWPSEIELPQVTIEHLAMMGDALDTKPQAIHFYVDGSKIGNHVGAGIACFLEYHTHSALAGCMSKLVQPAQHAFVGEHAAMTWALLWAIHMSDWIYTAFATHEVDLSFNFDAMNTGLQAAGIWRTTEHRDWKNVLRSLAHILEHRHTQKRLLWNHIKAHNQHPRNELVDQLAKYAASHPEEVGDCAVWMPWVTERRHQHTLPWIWYYEYLQSCPYDAPVLEGTLLTAHCTPAVFVNPENEISTQQDNFKKDCIDISFDFVLATANVLTLAAEDQYGRITPTKQQILMDQFVEAGCHIIGLQETRHKRIINQNNDHYHIVGHPCDAKGLDGIQMWITKTKPIYANGPCILMNHLRIVHATPSMLIVKVDMPNWKCILITGRAPHGGRPAFEGMQYWDQISTKIRKFANTMPVFFFGDTNGHLGTNPTSAVGSHFASSENAPGTTFHDWLLEHSLWLPCTFRQFHTGEKDATHVSPDGQHETRIDYVALPSDIVCNYVASWVDDTIDFGGTRVDHFATFCRCQFDKTVRNAQSPKQRWSKRPSRFAMAEKIREPSSRSILHESLSNLAWNADPHASADHLAWCTQQAICQLAPTTKRWRRKYHVDEDTWAIVEEKKMHFRQLRALKKTRTTTMLQVVLHAWKAQTSATPIEAQHDHTGWMQMIDHAIATTTARSKATAKRATAAIRKADTQYYLHLAQQSGHAYTHEGLTAVWRQIKAVLPRNKMKQFQAKPDIDDELMQHFADLEAGTKTTYADCFQHCINRNNNDLDERPRCRQLALADLPTLAEIEELCLKQRPNRASGLDSIVPEVCRYAAKEVAPYIHNVILKSFLWGVEPLRYKGGQLCAIWKQKQSRQDASGYRGILLAEVYGKVLHAWARQRLLPTLVCRRAQGQIGGLPSQQTTTAIQLLKLHGRQGRHRHLTTAVIFIDLKAAFHHLLREYVFKMKDPLQQHELCRFLDSKDFNIEQLAADLRHACDEQPADIPTGLRVFLHDLHKSTWFTLEPDRDQVVATERGTRPGSPMADLGFNLLMSRIMHQLGDGLKQLPNYERGCSLLGTQVPPISWVDDLAVPLTNEHPNQMVPLIQATVELLHTTFNAHGMTMNFESGKSEAVIMFRGQGANACRTALFDGIGSPCVVTATDSHILTLKVVATYRHLGARFAMDADGEVEINNRMAMARKSYQELKRAIFHNRNIPLKGRMQLYDSLIVARLMYACSVWMDVSNAQLQQLESMIIDHHRRMANIGFWNNTHMTDEELRHHLEMPSFRIIWARHRLGYLQHIGKHAAGFHRQLLLDEFQQGRGWLREVAADIRWMAKLVELPFDVPTDTLDWQEVWTVLQTCTRWKSMVKRAVKKHIIQDRIARDVEHYHNCIVDELKHAGFQTWQREDPEEVETRQCFRCDQCDKVFNSAHARGSHAYQVHGIMSMERPFVQSTVCPGCLKDHHTTWRVQQHLKYRQNGCWDRIYGAREPGEPCTITLPPHLQHVKRLPAIRRHQGPIRPTSIQRQRIHLRQRITALRAEGIDEYAWWHPERDPHQVQQACKAFAAGLQQWCKLETPNNIDFQNIMFGEIFKLGIPDLLGGRIFVHWIESRFYDDWPSDLDPDHIDILEEAYMQMLEDIPAWQKRHQMKMLTNLWTHLPPDEPDIPHRPMPQTKKPRSRIHEIGMPFAEMGEREVLRRQWRILEAPRPRVPATRGPYYIVHLYSGRRRPMDFHAAVEELIPRFSHLDIRILSIDTAVDPSLNVHDEKLWCFLVSQARDGRILGLLQGPPCETWTAARHQEQFDNEGRALRGPRPLRSTQDLWGLVQLSIRELAQIYVGNVLLLKGLLLACLVTFSGGATILEHPAMPFQDEISSIWRLGIINMLQRWPHGPFRRVSAEQWRFGSCGVKPTTFLYSNMNLSKALELCSDPMAQRPSTHLIGRHADGTYRTAKAKEYPAQLNRAFAQAIFTAMTRWSMAAGTAEADSYGRELAQLSASTECGEILPDYQPLR